MTEVSPRIRIENEETREENGFDPNNGQGYEEYGQEGEYQEETDYQGEDVYQGQDGYQGEDGYQGQDGYQGEDGYQCEEGYQGEDGYQGQDGYQGEEVYQGQDGYQGEDGYQSEEEYKKEEDYNPEYPEDYSENSAHQHQVQSSHISPRASHPSHANPHSPSLHPHPSHSQPHPTHVSPHIPPHASHVQSHAPKVPPHASHIPLHPPQVPPHASLRSHGPHGSSLYSPKHVCLPPPKRPHSSLGGPLRPHIHVQPRFEDTPVQPHYIDIYSTHPLPHNRRHQDQSSYQEQDQGHYPEQPRIPRSYSGDYGGDYVRPSFPNRFLFITINYSK